MFKLSGFIGVLLFFTFSFPSRGQDSLSFKGQVSAWMLYNSGNELPFYTGGRYIPQLNYILPSKNGNKIDFEASGNINGNAGTDFSDSIRYQGNLKPYRLWARYSSNQFEIRAGLQKINFGSASILRPLMWFDQVDPRDPLKMTDGVWGILGRYYFLNNANIWLWGLYGNDKPKGWELAGTKSHHPEFGGRFQFPVPSGEAGISYHHRIADMGDLGLQGISATEAPENRIGFDMKVDIITGLWIEGSWTNKNEDLGIYANQELINAGIDYTFGIGNGLYIAYEHLIASYDENPFEFKNTHMFSLLSVTYPVALFDNLSIILYYDWNNNSIYNFVSWQKQFRNLSLYLMGFANPADYRIPLQNTDQNLYAGRGIQIMLVYNH
ncbi:MAG TPA: hypothetical protein VMV47_12740 [Bacteroidales bacterium]|nr:hypothetical protein [Bacteroidales bacterium]